MKCFPTTLVALLCSFAPMAARAQIVTTPPRTISVQQTTSGGDATYQGTVVPNPQTSTYQTTLIGSAPAVQFTTTPPITCLAMTDTTRYQTLTCSGGGTTTQYWQTTCPNGVYGSPMMQWFPSSC